MSDYVYIQNYENRGLLGISTKVFDEIINIAISKMNGVRVSKEEGFLFFLNRPVKCEIKNGYLNADINVVISGDSNVNDVCHNIQEEINYVIASTTEFIPFCVNVKVVGIE